MADPTQDEALRKAAALRAAADRRDINILKSLQTALNSEKLVLIVGSGVTLSATATEEGPLERLKWKGMIEDALYHLKNECDQDESNNPMIKLAYAHLAESGTRSLLYAANIVKDELANRDKYPTWLEDLFGDLTVTNGTVLNALAALHEKGAKLLTTNYDHLLERSCNNLRTISRSATLEIARFTRGRRFMDGVFHIHGSYQYPDDVVFDSIDYYDVRMSGEVQDLLRNCLEDKVVLFVGCGSGLEDPNFNVLLKWVSEKYRKVAQTHCLLIKDGAPEDFTPLRRVKYGSQYSDLAPWLRRLLSGVHQPGNSGSGLNPSSRSNENNPGGTSDGNASGRGSALRSATWLDDLLKELVRLFPSAATRISMDEAAQSELHTSLSFLPHTSTYFSWINERGLLLYEKTLSDTGRQSAENVAAGVIQYARENGDLPPLWEILYYRCSVPWPSEATDSSYRVPPAKRLTDVMAALLYGLLQMLNISGRGFDTRLRDRLGSLSLGAEKISINSSDFWSTLQYGRFEDVTALFTGILYEVNVPFIVAVDNVERLEEQSDNIVTMLYNLCSSKRVKISAAVSGSISRVAGRNDLYKAREDTEYQECLQTLYFERQYSRREEIAPAEEGTIDWIWLHPSYVEWNNATSAILLIQGKPGSGKSVLAKSIAERTTSTLSNSRTVQLHACEKTFVCDWYYSTRGGEELMAHRSLMRSLLYQLLQHCPPAFEFFKSRYRLVEPCSEQWATIDNLEEILTDAAKSGIQAICVIDAMDESQDGTEPDQRRQKLLQHFSALVTEVSSSLKFIILSRPYPDIEEHFSYHRLGYDNLHIITLERENGPAIAKVVELGILDLQRAMHPRAAIARGMHTRAKRRGFQAQARHTQQFLSQREKELFEKIREYLLANASGVILWVSLILTMLKSLVASGIFTLLNLKETLETLPIDLMDLYRHIIKLVMGDHDHKRLSLARKALMLVSGANAYGSLTISELHEALALPEDLDTITTADAISLIEDQKLPIGDGDWTELRTRLRLLCGPLIEVIRATDRKQSSERLYDEDEVDGSDVVQLLHRTTKDVLANPQEAHELVFSEKDATDLVKRILRGYRAIVLPDEDAGSPILKIRLSVQDHGSEAKRFLNVPAIVEFLELRTFLPFFLKHEQLRAPEGPTRAVPEDMESQNLQLLAESLFDRFVLVQESPAANARYPEQQLKFADFPSRLRSAKDIICGAYIQGACRSGYCQAVSLLLSTMSVTLVYSESTAVFLGNIIRGLPEIARLHQLSEVEARLKAVLPLIRRYSQPNPLDISEPLPDGVSDEAKINTRILHPFEKLILTGKVVIQGVLSDDGQGHDLYHVGKVENAISRVIDFVSGICSEGDAVGHGNSKAIEPQLTYYQHRKDALKALLAATVSHGRGSQADSGGTATIKVDSLEMDSESDIENEELSEGDWEE